MAVSAIGFLILVVIVMALSIPDDPISQIGDEYELEAGPVSVRVSSAEPVAQNPAQYLGVLAPSPEFETASLGEDMNLEVSEPDFEGLANAQSEVGPDRILYAVYLGHDSRGVPVYIYSQGSKDLFDLIGQVFVDQGTIGRFGSTFYCCIPGPPPDNPYELGFESADDIEGPTTVITAEWDGLPQRVSVVAIQVGGEPVGWQRPTSGTAAFWFQHSDETLEWELVTPEDRPPRLVLRTPITMIAYDTHGEELASH